MPKGFCPCSQWDISKKWLHFRDSSNEVLWWTHVPHAFLCQGTGYLQSRSSSTLVKRTEFWHFLWKLVVSDGGLTIIFKRRDKLFWSLKDSGCKMPLMAENTMSKQKLACISRCPLHCNEMHRGKLILLQTVKASSYQCLLPPPFYSASLSGRYSAAFHTWPLN